MYCADCESVDDYFFSKTTWFWLFLPTKEAVSKVISACQELELELAQMESHCLSVAVHQSQLDSFFTHIAGALEAKELAGSKVTTTRTSQPPELQDVARMATFDVLMHRFKSKWLIESIESENYESWFQPIIHASSALSEQIDTYAHEALFRLKEDNNNIVPPDVAFSLAQHSDLLFSLDLVARRSAVTHAAAAQLTGKLFINFDPASIYDPSYCLRSTASAIYEIGMQPSDIVFEVTETNRANDINHLRGILTFYRSVGFKIALDDIGSGWSGLNMLQKIRPDYAKIDMELVRDVHLDVYKQNIVSSLIRIAKTNEIKDIAEGIENIDEAQWLISAGADLLQGYYFARPKFYEPKVGAAQRAEIEGSTKALKTASLTRKKQ